MPSSQSQRALKTKPSLEIRRARGEVSCAECRQHKVKCSKTIPCTTCVRKGVQHLCPNGATAPTDGPRSQSNRPHISSAKLLEMSKRIRQLEEALQALHSSVSTGPHPLLEEGSHRDGKSDADDTDLFDVLSHSNAGTHSHLPCPNVAETLLVVCSHVSRPNEPLLNGIKKDTEQTDVGTHHDDHGSLSAFCSCQSEMFPFTPQHIPTEVVQTALEERLPSYARASALIEAYLENLSWFFRAVDREQLFEELMPVVYKRRKNTSEAKSGASPESDPEVQEPADPHVLALLFAVFAAGAVADLTLPPWNDEADLYHHLSRTALGLKPVFEGADLHAVQTITLIASFDLFSCRKNNLEGTWKILSFSSTLAATMNLHRDPTRFDLPPKLVQRRRRLFWELRSLDVCKTICTGWPLIFSADVIDCEFPEEAADDVRYDDNGKELPPSIWWFRYRMMKEVMSELVTKLGGSSTVKYSEILELDQKIRNFNPGGVLNKSASANATDPCNVDRRTVISQAQIRLTKDMALLLLHKNFFVRALVEDPSSPIRTQFGPSFVATFRTASSLLTLVQELFIQHSANFLMRVWPIWAHALSASVMLGSIAACGSPPDLAAEAYNHFDRALQMFAQVAMHPVIKCGLGILQRLREQAQRSLANRRNEIAALPTHDPSLSELASRTPKKDNEEGEFNIVSQLGRLARKGMKGEFGPVQPRLQSLMYAYNPADTGSTQTPSAEQYSMDLETLPESPSEVRSNPFASAGAYTRNGYPGASSHEGAETSYTETGQRYSHHQTLEVSHKESIPEVLGEPSSMQVDNAWSPAASTLVHDDSIQESSFPSETRPAYAFNPFDALPEMPSSSAPSSSSNSISSVSATGGAPSFVSSSSHFETDPFFSAPSAYGGFPGMSFDPDYDVSYDMRVTPGEGAFPYLSEDMEAWRLILEDSRFFGYPSGQQDAGMPQL